MSRWGALPARGAIFSNRDSIFLSLLFDATCLMSVSCLFWHLLSVRTLLCSCGRLHEPGAPGIGRQVVGWQTKRWGGRFFRWVGTCHPISIQSYAPGWIRPDPTPQIGTGAWDGRYRRPPLQRLCPRPVHLAPVCRACPLILCSLHSAHGLHSVYSVCACMSFGQSAVALNSAQLCCGIRNAAGPLLSQAANSAANQRRRLKSGPYMVLNTGRRICASNGERW